MSSCSGRDNIRGVASRVPHVINCFTASGPNCSGVGFGWVGISASISLRLGDFGRSMKEIQNMKMCGWLDDVQGVPLIAASILLRVGLGGSESPDEFALCSCSTSRVFP